jgi:hypothetical protein
LKEDSALKNRYNGALSSLWGTNEQNSGCHLSGEKAVVVCFQHGAAPPRPHHVFQEEEALVCFPVGGSLGRFTYFNKDGIPYQLKSRLVACGYSEIKGLDTYSAV